MLMREGLGTQCRTRPRGAAARGRKSLPGVRTACARVNYGNVDAHRHPLMRRAGSQESGYRHVLRRSVGANGCDERDIHTVAGRGGCGRRSDHPCQSPGPRQQGGAKGVSGPQGQAPTAWSQALTRRLRAGSPPSTCPPKLRAAIWRALAARVEQARDLKIVAACGLAAARRGGHAAARGGTT